MQISRMGIMTFAVTAFFALLPVNFLYGSDSAKSPGHRESAVNRAEWEQRFLYRAVDDLNSSLDYANDAIRGLKTQLDAVELLEPSRRESDLRAVLDWYQAYADWIGEKTQEFEDDLSQSYAGKSAEASLSDRYEEIADGYAVRGSQLEDHLARLGMASDRIERRMGDLRQALDYLASAAFQEEKLRDKQERPYGRKKHDDDLYTRYRDITDNEIARMQLEIRSLGDMLKHFAVLLELGRMELDWLALKANDSSMLSNMANVLGAGSRTLIADACARMIKTYESDIAKIRRKAEDLDRLRRGLSRSGTLRTLDRQEELAGYYERMKNRYERHAGWLSEQLGGYRADLVELAKGN